MNRTVRFSVQLDLDKIAKLTKLWPLIKSVFDGTMATKDIRLIKQEHTVKVLQNGNGSIRRRNSSAQAVTIAAGVIE